MYYLVDFARTQGAKDKQKRKSRALDVANKTAIGAGVGASVGSLKPSWEVIDYINQKSKIHKWGKGTNYKQPFYDMSDLRYKIQEHLTDSERAKNLNLSSWYTAKHRPNKVFRKVARQKIKKEIIGNILSGYKKPMLKGAGLGALGLGAYQLGKTAKKD